MGKEKERQLALESAVLQLQKKNTGYRCYCEDDAFTLNGESIFTVLDFWRFLYSDLSNQHEVIAEYLVSRALEIEKPENVSSWTGYDLSYRAKRIEVKSTTYVHPWNKTKVSKTRTFSIAPSSNYYWYGRSDIDGKAKARQNELYVFCLNTNQDIEKADPLSIDPWTFYVVPTFIINAMCERYNNPNQKTISLGVVRKLSNGAVGWLNLRHAIDEAIDRIDAHIEELDAQQP